MVLTDILKLTFDDKIGVILSDNKHTCHVPKLSAPFVIGMLIDTPTTVDLTCAIIKINIRY